MTLNVQPDLSADELNSFFVSVGPRIATEIRTRNTATDLNVRLPRVGACSFRPSTITLDQLGHTILHMRNSAACGADGVCIRMLKTGFPAIGGVILHIINSCITRSDIPSDWKHSIVQPIFKSGNPSDPANFRPISLVPVIMKIVESYPPATLLLPFSQPSSVIHTARLPPPPLHRDRATVRHRQHPCRHR